MRKLRGLAFFQTIAIIFFSCYINGEPWRTVDRKTVPFAGSTIDLNVRKFSPDSLTHFLSITWNGNYLGSQGLYQTISLLISIPNDFSVADFSAWQGRRLMIDGVNSYFEADLNNQGGRGTGTIYFNIAQLDSTGPGLYTGRMSGLLEADFGSFKLTSGRFDHDLGGAVFLW